jgi:hypothetical protein
VPRSSQELAACCLIDAACARLVLTSETATEVHIAIRADLASAPEVRRALSLPRPVAAAAGERDAGADSWLALPRPALSALANGPGP